MFRPGAIALVSVSLLALAAPPSSAVPADIGTVSTVSPVSKVSTVSQVPDSTSRKACSWVNAFAALYPNWSTSTYCASFWGSSESTTIAYAWAIQPGTNTRICVKGLGFAKQPDGSRKATWYNLGCGTSGGALKIPWGNSAGMPKVKAQTQPAFLGGAYAWTD